MADGTITTALDREGGRYVILVDGEEAGFAAFREADGARDFHHTVIDPAFRGAGLSRPLITAALDGTREAGLRVIPTCSAVERFVEKNPPYADLVE